MTEDRSRRVPGDGDNDGDGDGDGPAPRAALRAGAALARAGRHRAAATAWTAPLESSRPPDPPVAALCRGLSGLATAIARARERDWAGATAAARDAGERIADLPAAVEGVRLPPVRAFLAALSADPERIERAPPVVPAVPEGPDAPGPDDSRPTIAGLTFPAAGVAARALAATVHPDRRATVDRALARATRAVDRAVDQDVDQDVDRAAAGSPFPGLVLEYLSTPNGVVLDRLDALLARRARREADLDGLFEAGDAPGAGDERGPGPDG